MNLKKLISLKFVITLICNLALIFFAYKAFEHDKNQTELYELKLEKKTYIELLETTLQKPEESVSKLEKLLIENENKIKEKEAISSSTNYFFYFLIGVMILLYILDFFFERKIKE
ncbi:hypothetical protein [Flavobacterium beibuense]